MKRRLKILTFTSIMLFVIFTHPIYAQNNFEKLRYQDEIWKLWTVEANAGLLSFYGDLSSYDANYIDKLKYESGQAFSLNISKHFSRLFGISGQLLIGKLNGSADNSSFEADILEYNLNLKLNLFNLCFPDNKGKFGITARAGIGQFWYSSAKSVYTEGSNEITKRDARVPEFTYLIGAGSFIRVIDRFGISLEISVRQCQTDWLDVSKSNNDFDYYSYTSLGITYYFDRFKKEPIKNKARIAHNKLKLKHLSD